MNAVARVGFILVIGFNAWGDTPAWTPASAPLLGSATFTGTRGELFRYSGGYSTYVTKLGVFDAGGDGLANAHAVGLWDAVRGTLLRSAIVPAGTEAPLENGYRYVSIEPLQVFSFANYVVGAQFSAGDADHPVDDVTLTRNAIRFAPEIQIYYGQNAIGSDLPFPNSTYYRYCSFGECFQGDLLDANFQFSSIPEPSVCVLLSLGLISLRFYRRKSMQR